MSKQYFTKEDVANILYETNLPLKKPPAQLPLDDIAKSLDGTFSNYLSLSRDSVKSELKKATEKSKKSIKDINEYLSKIQRQLLIMRQYFNKIDHIVCDDDHDDGLYTFLVWHIRQQLDDNISNLENYVDSTLEKVKKLSPRRGAPRHGNINGLLFGLVFLYMEITDKKPGMNPEGPFARFAYACLEHIGEYNTDLSRPIRNVLDGSYIKAMLGNGSLPAK
jgi:hypothetical protein